MRICHLTDACVFIFQNMYSAVKKETVRYLLVTDSISASIYMGVSTHDGQYFANTWYFASTTNEVLGRTKIKE